MSGLRMRNDDDVVPVGDHGELSSNGLSQAAFDAILVHMLNTAGGGYKLQVTSYKL